MTFLQPILLAGLPLVALPILIHLINRQRHQTVPWGAMMFLLDAKRMTRGLARLRYWLIMALRMLAMAALFFAAARPLASGRLGLMLGGTPDTTIVILDRSASMEQQSVQTGESKRTAGLAKIAQLVQTVGGSTRLVLIENGENQPETIESAESLRQLSSTSATDTSADIPAMLQTAFDYVTANQTGRTDIWICSDLRSRDWRSDDGRWAGLRDGFGRLDGVTFYLLSYPEVARENLAVWVDRVRCRTTDRDTALVLDITVRRPSEAAGRVEVPLEFIINGARSVENIELLTSQDRLQGHTIPLNNPQACGWGRVALPADANLRDNQYFFVYGKPEERRTAIISDDPRTAESLRIAATSPVDPAMTYTAAVLPSDHASELDWQSTSLILWHAPLPKNELVAQLETFLDSGRPILFFPTDRPTTDALWGLRWTAWQEAASEKPFLVSWFREDSDLLAHAESGAALGVGKLRTFRYCRLEGSAQALATLDDGNPLLVRRDHGRGSAYFVATLPRPFDSSLLQDGVVFYVLIQRALEVGAMSRTALRQLSPGSEAARALIGWQLLSASPAVLSSLQPLRAGVFRKADRLVALNRPAAEDDPETIGDDTIEQLFQGLQYRHVKEEIGSTRSLAGEIWRAFVLFMAVAMLVEAWLCLPKESGRKKQGPGRQTAAGQQLDMGRKRPEIRNAQ